MEVNNIVHLIRDRGEGVEYSREGRVVVGGSAAQEAGSRRKRG